MCTLGGQPCRPSFVPRRPKPSRWSPLPCPPARQALLRWDGAYTAPGQHPGCRLPLQRLCGATNALPRGAPCPSLPGANSARRRPARPSSQQRHRGGGVEYTSRIGAMEGCRRREGSAWMTPRRGEFSDRHFRPQETGNRTATSQRGAGPPHQGHHPYSSPRIGLHMSGLPWHMHAPDSAPKLQRLTESQPFCVQLCKLPRPHPFHGRNNWPLQLPEPCDRPTCKTSE